KLSSVKYLRLNSFRACTCLSHTLNVFPCLTTLVLDMTTCDFLNRLPLTLTCLNLRFCNLDDTVNLSYLTNLTALYLPDKFIASTLFKNLGPFTNLTQLFMVKM